MDYEIEKFYFVYKDGKYHSTLSKSHVESKLSKIAPEIKIRDMSIPERIVLDSKASGSWLALKEFLDSVYEKMKKGFFGDVFCVTRVCCADEFICSIDFYGHLVFPTPGMTSDLVPFVKDANDNLFFIGILRKFPPAQGRIALIGGFRAMKGLDFQTPYMNVVEEAEEEVGMKISYNPGQFSERHCCPYLSDLKATVQFGAISEQTELKYVTSVYTGLGRAEKEFGQQRVSETAAYSFLLKVDRVLTEHELATYLQADDDALEVVVWNISERGAPQFPLSHHQFLFNNAMKNFNFKIVANLGGRN